MSRQGAPELRINTVAELAVAIVAAQWHRTVMDGLVAGARRALQEADISDPVVLRVPGSFELPVAAARLARAGYQAIIALGVVIRGETPHFDYVCQAATTGLTTVAVQTGVPIGFGVLTCDNDEQARDRAGLSNSKEDKGYEAAQAALATVAALQEASV
jgi:6,7-dimethyl-8-ribityllumazine synthase